jgi:hypothetical protein
MSIPVNSVESYRGCPKPWRQIAPFYFQITGHWNVIMRSEFVPLTIRILLKLHFHSCFDTKVNYPSYRGADKSLARPGRKQVTATEDFDFHISYL